VVFPEKLSSRASWRFLFFVALVVASGVVTALRGFDDLPLTPEALRDAVRSWGPAARRESCRRRLLSPLLVPFPSSGRHL